MFSREQVEEASGDDLRKMLRDAMTECRRERTATAHWNLQYNMLFRELQETKEQHKMEIFIAEKDIEALLRAKEEQRNPQLMTPALSTIGRAMSPQDQLVLDLRNSCQFLEIDNVNLRQRERHLKTLLLEREDSMTAENERLCERIRQNRKHANLYRETHRTADSPPSHFATPFVTPARRNNHVSTERTPRGGHQFDALLLADQVLQEAAASAPSTPHATYVQPQHRNEVPHTPHTPRQAMFKPIGPYFVHPSTGRETASAAVDATPIRHHHGRHRSRDSTISASEDEDEVEDVEEVFIKTSAQSAKRGPRSQPPPVTPKMHEKHLTVTQSAKRKAYIETPTRHQKNRKLNEGVGLGIHGLGDSPM
jgi:hypothetical protein